jgi:Protein kinase domain
MAPAGDNSFESIAAGTVIGERFVVQRLLGSGGMGDVYLAEHKTLPDRKFAIKVLKPEFSSDPRFAAMLHQEALKQSRLDHENIVQTQDFLQWAGRACLIQAFAEGSTLADMVAQQPHGLPLATALPLMLQILAGLDAAHEKRVLHCDVKPANVIVDAKGRARVTDFGIARDIGPIARDSGVVGAGTPEYMSPEQIVSPTAVDHRTDVFSAGIVFFEVLCGRLPFAYEAAANDSGLPQTYQDAPDVRRFAESVPEPIARIVATALQRDPDRRFQGCGEFRAAIVEHQRRERWRRTWLPSLAVAAVVGVGAAVGLYQWRQVLLEEELKTKAIAHERAVESAGKAIDTATNSLNLMCREWIDRQVKGGALPTVIATGNADLVRGFKDKLAEIDGNVSRFAGDYGKMLAELKQKDTAVVGDAFKRQSPADTLVPNALDLVRTDADAMRNSAAKPPQETELKARCPPPRTVQAG